MQEKLAELDPVNHPLPLSKREEYEEKEKVNADLAVILGVNRRVGPNLFLLKMGKITILNL
jgi:hypothetical protein